MSAQEITESFRRLSSIEKIRLLQELWDEAIEESARVPLSESHRLLLEERLRQHEENPEDVELWSKVREEILSEL